MVLLLYVDDILLTGTSDALLDHMVTLLCYQFAMKQLGDMNYFLGIKAHRTVNDILLTQKKYTLELLKKSHMTECIPCNTPVAKGPRVSIDDGTILSDVSSYRTIVGMLYLKGTIGYGITLRKGDITELTAYTDSDWGNCPETARSTCGYAIFIGSSLISWSSKKQPTVSRSTAEAEYKCLSVATAELEWLSSLLSELHITLKLPIALYCDSSSVIYLTANHVSHSSAKHIKIHYHVVRELVASGFLNVQHIASEHQLADLFTKGLCAPTFNSLLHHLLGSSASTLVSSVSTSTCSYPSANSAYTSNVPAHTSISAGLATGFTSYASISDCGLPKHVSFSVS
ncbi:uncharacterized protein LOC113291665 [Papaver somniferum]|uniref:uncharacterized protein LOC113291665 n=1 Tax=Papaver somniferum TaxID=3469 RepID=UPI000E700AEE|nr:uncharacterized protein LOC113291665 [Papaver somniferum]